jgi:hypothetical protein
LAKEVEETGAKMAAVEEEEAEAVEVEVKEVLPIPIGMENSKPCNNIVLY